jgi:hypothetical protein
MSKKKRSGRERLKSEGSTANDHKVGYRNPPRHSQFKKGQSGNPKGRARDRQNYATILKNEINDSVEVVENGRRRKLRKGQVMLRQQVNKAVAADHKAFAQVLDLMHRHGLFGTLTSGIPAFTTEQLTTMREILDLFELLKE